MVAEALETATVARIDQLESVHECMMVETAGRPNSNPVQGSRRRYMWFADRS
jgi:hypothetical protein